MILIEETERRSAVTNLQRTIFNTGGLELGRRPVHIFNRLARCVVGRSA